MFKQVVVLNTGYAGTGGVQRLETELRHYENLTYIDDANHYFVFQESHCCIRDSTAQKKMAIPIHEIKRPVGESVRDTVVGINFNERVIKR